MCWNWRSPCLRSKGERWKDLVFTKEQPFLPGEAGEEWLKKKEAYRRMKAEGKI
jgi:D-proline reductase (dithiol) PrdB